MKISKEIESYCKTCKKHTTHTVRNFTRKSQSGLGVGTRRHLRAIRGYVGSVEPKIHPKKLGKRQKVMITCKVCKKQAERVFGQRTKKKIEIKR